MITQVLAREAVDCGPCMKAHQLRLVKRANRGVAVLGGHDLWFPGVKEGRDTFHTAIAMIANANERGDSRCPLGPARRT